MPAQVAILARKVLLDDADITWVSEPMYWGSFARADIYLQVHGTSPSLTGVSLSFEGTTQPDENATWTTISAPVAYSDPTALTDKGTNKYVRTEMFPYVRVKVSVTAAASLRAAEVSVGGTLSEEI
jgi:hypothetical protein